MLPTIRQTAVLLPGITKLKSNATSVVPDVCPNRRAIPSIPLAPPERFVGAEEIIVLLFGVWKSPKPAPHSISRRIKLISEDSAVRPDREKSPTANSTIPTLPNIPGWIRSTRYPAKGAVTRVANGHGVSRSPVITSLCPKVFCRKKGKETIADICAINEQMEVRIDSRKIGIRNRSKGSNGVAWLSWRRT